jgi:hypothetical protein
MASEVGPIARTHVRCNVTKPRFHVTDSRRGESNGRCKRICPRTERTNQAIDGGCDPQDIADELAQEGNYVFGHYNLEIYLEAKPIGGG